MYIDNRTTLFQFTFNEKRLTSISETLLNDSYETIPEFSLSFVDPEEIQQLNNLYRDQNEITDVLSFPSDGEIDPESGVEYLGDILICIQRAAEQAISSGHPLENEIELLFIHGLLHLIGYDHQTEEEKSEMWNLQAGYLNKFEIFLGRTPGEDLEY